jgi:hypothetical protein
MDLLSFFLKKNKMLIKIIIKKIRDFVIGDSRSIILSKKICKIILDKIKKKKKIYILDYGSGFQPKVILSLHNILNNKYQIQSIIHCYDFYSNNELKILNKNKKIIFKNISSFNTNKKFYDFSLILDVLHHIGIYKENKILDLIKILFMKSRYIIIKDHFIYGFWSFHTLRIMDFLGNCFNNVQTPINYFTVKKFNFFLRKHKFKVIKKIMSIKLYPSYLLYMSNPNFNFIYLIKGRKP